MYAAEALETKATEILYIGHSCEKVTTEPGPSPTHGVPNIGAETHAVDALPRGSNPPAISQLSSSLVSLNWSGIISWFHSHMALMKLS